MVLPLITRTTQEALKQSLTATAPAHWESELHQMVYDPHHSAPQRHARYRNRRHSGHRPHRGRIRGPPLFTAGSGYLLAKDFSEKSLNPAVR